MIEVVPPTAASGKPPAIDLPSTLTSGVTPNASSAPPYHLPHVLTSSKIRSAPISGEFSLGLDRHHEGVVGPVIATLELQDPAAARDRAREPHREQRRVEAGHRELEAVQPESPADVVRERTGVDGFETEDRTVRDPLAHRLREDRVAMARDERAEGHAEVDVLRPVGVPYAGTLRRANVERVRIHEAVLAVDAEGDPLLRGLPRLRGFLRPPAKRLEFFLP